MYNNLKNKSIIRFNVFRVLIICMFFYDTLLNYAKAIISRLPFFRLFGDYIIPVSIVVLFAVCLFNTRSIRIHISDFIIILFVILSLCFSYAFFPNNQEFFDAYNLRNVFFKAIPFLLIGSNFDTSESTYKLLIRLSCVAIIINVLYLSIYVKTNYLDDNMHWAYLLLPHVLLVIRGVFDNEKKIIRTIVSLVGTVYIVSMGSRGPILILFIYFGVLLFLNLLNKNRKAGFVSLLLMVILACYILSGAYLTFIKFLRETLSNAGLSVRALDLFIIGEYISYTSGRDVIYNILWSKIMDNPILGYGVFGEWQFVGYSAHNLYFQICMHYGLILGTALSFMYIITVVRGYIKSSDQVAKAFILLYAVFTFVRGVFGADYFSNYFFFLLGLSIQQIRVSKHYKGNEQLKTSTINK